MNPPREERRETADSWERLFWDTLKSHTSFAECDEEYDALEGFRERRDALLAAEEHLPRGASIGKYVGEMVVRVTPELFALVQDDAIANGRTVAQNVRFHLNRVFGLDSETGENTP